MSEHDFREVDLTESKEEKNDDYEEVCYICHRPESVAGKMIKIPNNICICQDCMQRTFDGMNQSGFRLDDILGPMQNFNGKMPNISMINLSDLQNMMPNAQKVKKKIRILSSIYLRLRWRIREILLPIWSRRE